VDFNFNESETISDTNTPFFTYLRETLLRLSRLVCADIVAIDEDSLSQHPGAAISLHEKNPIVLF
jgi:hypothetical protein